MNLLRDYWYYYTLNQVMIGLGGFVVGVLLKTVVGQFARRDDVLGRMSAIEKWMEWVEDDSKAPDLDDTEKRLEVLEATVVAMTDHLDELDEGLAEAEEAIDSIEMDVEILSGDFSDDDDQPTDEQVADAVDMLVGDVKMVHYGPDGKPASVQIVPPPPYGDYRRTIATPDVSTNEFNGAAEFVRDDPASPGTRPFSGTMPYRGTEVAEDFRRGS
jgi:uncharacterized coiled-coil protein SlyX